MIFTFILKENNPFYLDYLCIEKEIVLYIQIQFLNNINSFIVKNQMFTHRIDLINFALYIKYYQKLFVNVSAIQNCVIF